MTNQYFLADIPRNFNFVESDAPGKMSPILVAGNGQGKILTLDELRQMFALGLRTDRDRAMLGIGLFTSGPCSEALALQTTDIKSEKLTFRKSTTKSKLKTRVVDIQPGLVALLAEYQPNPRALFPGGGEFRLH